jgi:hypothetical protein
MLGWFWGGVKLEEEVQGGLGLMGIGWRRGLRDFVGLNFNYCVVN